MTTMLVYLGRRGPMGRFACQLLDAASGDRTSLCVLVSKQSADLDLFLRDERVILADTFSAGVGAALRLDNLLRIRAMLAREIKARRVESVIFLMPHVWAPLLSDVVLKSGAAYVVIVHDAQAHPGDVRGLMNLAMHSDLRRANRVIALSAWVAANLVRRKPYLSGRIDTLFHPDLTSATCAPQKREPGPLRLAFLGRILPYKGLPLLVEAVEKVKAGGINVELLVRGEGDLEQYRARLKALGAHIYNSWATEQELAHSVAWSDAVIACHTEASQSGVVAFAFGHGAPVIATPVGGLTEQVIHGVNGMIASSVSVDAVAEQITHFAKNILLVETLKAGVRDTAGERSAVAFLRRLLDAPASAQSTRPERINHSK